VLDDDAKLGESLGKLLRLEGYHVDVLCRADEVEPRVRRHLYDAALIDLRMPERSGIDVLQALRDLDPAVAVLIMTAYGTIDAAAQAFQLGAKDFLSKPVRREVLLAAVERALEVSQLARHARLLRERLATPLQALLGDSPALRRPLALARKAASTDLPVRILGDTGTGKSLLARAIHAESRRAAGPLVEEVLTTMSADLQKSALFGHTAGAFTGASKARRGLFQTAAGGSLFLDEVGDLALDVQVALLRAIEEKKIRPLGSTDEIAVDVRILTATNANLPRLVQEGLFRQDLFERLNGFLIELPPLRERTEDIPLLVAHYARQAAPRGRSVPNFSPDALKALQEYPWPGNVRELKHVVERAVVVAEGDTIGVEDCLLRRSPQNSATAERYDQTLEEFEMEAKRRYLSHLLDSYDGDLQKVADHAGLHITNLRKWLHKLGVPATRPRS